MNDPYIWPSLCDKPVTGNITFGKWSDNFSSDSLQVTTTATEEKLREEITRLKLIAQRLRNTLVEVVGLDDLRSLQGYLANQAGINQFGKMPLAVRALVNIREEDIK